MSLIDDLLKEVSNPNCDVVSILRKSLIISHKLDLKETEKWIKNELEGYKGNELIPEYRNIKGTVKFFNPFHGWCPMIFDSLESELYFSTRKIADSIPKCLDLISKEKGILMMSFAPEVLNEFWKHNPSLQMETYLIIDRSSILDVIEMVKNEILNWGLLLSDKGITGDNINFSIKEKEIASATPEIKNYYINISGNVENSQIQQNTLGSTQITNKN